ncbi:MAG TPA: hypothetical protein VNC61_15680 [Acidimicrobiales bacterium]|nr:hypothetical protein [Acidimicrobiales bacterium]
MRPLLRTRQLGADPEGRDSPRGGDGMAPELTELAQRMEDHEVAVWMQCVDAVSALPGNPLDAVIDRSGHRPLVALRAVDRGDFNRVIGLGVRTRADPGEIDAIFSFYEKHGQQEFWIEVTPISRPAQLTDWLASRGLACDGPGTYKMWRRVEDPPEMPSDIEVRRLGPEDSEALVAINITAWGAWSMPVSMAAWFGATVGAPGVQHYGVFEEDRLVATGALFVGDGLGWLGFDATHPRHQGRKLRQAISSVRMEDAAAQGCRFIHAETSVAPSRRAMADGWHLLYEKQNFASVRVRAETAAPHRVSAGRHAAAETTPGHSSSTPC